jgi:hypothetical protein
LTSCRFIPALNEPNFLLSRLRLQEIGFGFRRGRLMTWDRAQRLVLGELILEAALPSAERRRRTFDWPRFDWG